MSDLDTFLADYDADDNAWWRLGSGDHMNLFDAMRERAEAAAAQERAAIVACLRQQLCYDDADRIESGEHNEASAPDPDTGERALPEREQLDAEWLAMKFHATYEALAPEYGYKTREASAVPWEDVPAPNQALMIHVAREVIAWLPGNITLPSSKPPTPPTADEQVAALRPGMRVEIGWKRHGEVRYVEGVLWDDHGGLRLGRSMLRWGDGTIAYDLASVRVIDPVPEGSVVVSRDDVEIMLRAWGSNVVADRLRSIVTGEGE